MCVRAAPPLHNSLSFGIALAPLGVTVQIRDRSFRCTLDPLGGVTLRCAHLTRHDRMHETAVVYALFVAHLQWSLEFGPSGRSARTCACGGVNSAVSTVVCRRSGTLAATPTGQVKIKMQDRMFTQRSFVGIAPKLYR